MGRKIRYTLTDKAKEYLASPSPQHSEPIDTPEQIMSLMGYKLIKTTKDHRIVERYEYQDDSLQNVSQPLANHIFSHIKAYYQSQMEEREAEIRIDAQLKQTRRIRRHEVDEWGITRSLSFYRREEQMLKAKLEAIRRKRGE